jgi:nucleoside-diphosphate-sugar epimerase
VTFVEADLRTAALEPLLEGVDAVVNEAATPGLTLSWDEFDQYESCNVTGLRRLAAACVAVGVGHLVQASTSSVYGADAAGPEDSPTEPISPYGVTKLSAEHLVEAFGAAHGLPVTILRYFSVYGPRQRPDMAYRIVCERLLAGRPVPLHGDGDQSRSNTYVGDCVAATRAALDRPAPGTRTFNVGGGREVKLLDAMAMLADLLDVELLVERLPARPGDQRRTVADTTRAREVLGWAPSVEPEEGLALEARWVRSRLGLDPR